MSLELSNNPTFKYFFCNLSICTHFFSLLSSSIEGLTSSLYPFTWQHTLVSVLPSQMVSVADFIQAPTPYIIGLLKTNNQSDIFSQLSETDQVNK